MPRGGRKKSSTGIYHVMLRGINGQKIFKDNEDYEKLIQTIKKYKGICEYKLYAYCLMSNHIHLLIEEGKEDLGIVFRRIGASYVYWYNCKYKRIGPLFQDRYKSEAVENDQYFLNVLRYIHQNPIKAGIHKDIKRYPWSSYNGYVGQRSICDIDFALSFFADEENREVALFKKFNKEANDDQCLEYEKRVKLDNIEVEEIIKASGIEDVSRLQHLEKAKRDKIIKALKDRGISIRQIETVTGISFGVIRRV